MRKFEAMVGTLSAGWWKEKEDLARVCTLMGFLKVTRLHGILRFTMPNLDAFVTLPSLSQYKRHAEYIHTWAKKTLVKVTLKWETSALVTILGAFKGFFTRNKWTLSSATAIIINSSVIKEDDGLGLSGPCEPSVGKGNKKSMNSPTRDAVTGPAHPPSVSKTSGEAENPGPCQSKMVENNLNSPNLQEKKEAYQRYLEKWKICIYSAQLSRPGADRYVLRSHDTTKAGLLLNAREPNFCAVGGKVKFRSNDNSALSLEHLEGPRGFPYSWNLGDIAFQRRYNSMGGPHILPDRSNPMDPYESTWFLFYQKALRCFRNLLEKMETTRRLPEEAYEKAILEGQKKLKQDLKAAQIFTMYTHVQDKRYMLVPRESPIQMSYVAEAMRHPVYENDQQLNEGPEFGWNHMVLPNGDLLNENQVVIFKPSLSSNEDFLSDQDLTEAQFRSEISKKYDRTHVVYSPHGEFCDIKNCAKCALSHLLLVSSPSVATHRDKVPKVLSKLKQAMKFASQERRKQEEPWLFAQTMRNVSLQLLNQNWQRSSGVSAVYMGLEYGCYKDYCMSVHLNNKPGACNCPELHSPCAKYDGLSFNCDHRSNRKFDTGFHQQIAIKLQLRCNFEADRLIYMIATAICNCRGGYELGLEGFIDVFFGYIWNDAVMPSSKEDVKPDSEWLQTHVPKVSDVAQTEGPIPEASPNITQEEANMNLLSFYKAYVEPMKVKFTRKCFIEDLFSLENGNGIPPEVHNAYEQHKHLLYITPNHQWIPGSGYDWALTTEQPWLTNRGAPLHVGITIWLKWMYLHHPVMSRPGRDGREGWRWLVDSVMQEAKANNTRMHVCVGVFEIFHSEFNHAFSVETLPSGGNIGPVSLWALGLNRVCQMDLLGFIARSLRAFNPSYYVCTSASSHWNMDLSSKGFHPRFLANREMCLKQFGAEDEPFYLGHETTASIISALLNNELWRFPKSHICHKDFMGHMSDMKAPVSSLFRMLQVAGWDIKVCLFHLRHDDLPKTLSGMNGFFHKQNPDSPPSPKRHKGLNGVSGSGGFREGKAPLNKSSSSVSGPFQSTGSNMGTTSIMTPVQIGSSITKDQLSDIQAETWFFMKAGLPSSSHMAQGLWTTSVIDWGEQTSWQTIFYQLGLENCSSKVAALLSGETEYRCTFHGTVDEYNNDMKKIRNSPFFIIEAIAQEMLACNAHISSTASSETVLAQREQFSPLHDVELDAGFGSPKPWNIMKLHGVFDFVNHCLSKLPVQYLYQVLIHCIRILNVPMLNHMRMAIHAIFAASLAFNNYISGRQQTLSQRNKERRQNQSVYQILEQSQIIEFVIQMRGFMESQIPLSVLLDASYPGCLLADYRSLTEEDRIAISAFVLLERTRQGEITEVAIYSDLDTVSSPSAAPPQPNLNDHAWYNLADAPVGLAHPPPIDDTSGEANHPGPGSGSRRSC